MKVKNIVNTSMSGWTYIKPKEQNQGCYQWCIDYDSDGFFSFASVGVFFSKKEDASVFALRWS
jgi:hypothetical protein